MRKIFAVLPLVFFSACASIPPAAERRVEVIRETKVPKAAAYKAALVYFAKNQGDAKSAMQVNDAASAQFVTKALAACNLLRQPGDFNDYSVSFTLDFQAKDNRARFLFEDVLVVDRFGQPTIYAYNQVTGPEKLEVVKPCLTQVVDGVVAGVRGTATEKDW